MLYMRISSPQVSLCLP